MIIVRYADDIVVGFEHERDARRFRDAMRERLQEFSLSLRPEKTRLIEFGRFAADRCARRGVGKPETFTFLGFVFVCGKSRSGKQVVTGFYNYHAVPTNALIPQPRSPDAGGKR